MRLVVPEQWYFDALDREGALRAAMGRLYVCAQNLVLITNPGSNIARQTLAALGAAEPLLAPARIETAVETTK